MRVIDAHTGKEVAIGDMIDHGDGERFKLLDIDEGLMSASAVIERSYRHFVSGQLVCDRVQIPLIVKFLHPNFLFQKVAFIPS